MSDTHPGTTHPDNNNDRPWWGLPCTVTPCFGARLVQEGNQLHYLADRAGIRGQFSDADAYHLDQAFPLLMKQLELMLTSGELNPRHQHTVTLYARGLTCEADTLGSCGYVYITLGSCLLDQHYGLTLNDTPFADERVIEQHIEAGISLCDAVNFLVEKYALVRTDQPGFSACTRSQLINSIDILRARRATGLMVRDNYRTVNNITLGKHPGAKQ